MTPEERKVISELIDQIDILYQEVLCRDCTRLAAVISDGLKKLERVSQYDINNMTFR